MRLVPIPFDMLDECAPIWGPFVEGIAKRQRCNFWQRADEIFSKQVRLILIAEDHDAKALLGVSVMQRGDDKVARIVWTTGKDRHQWVHLLPELEQMFQDMGCVGMEAMARPGWSKELKRHGYRMTHIKFEKDF